MSDAFKFFINHALYTPEEHPDGWDKFVYDDENIHYDVLSILFKDCGPFASAILGLDEATRIISIMPPMIRKHPFDLEIETSDSAHYIEVKTWSGLGKDQFNRQQQFLEYHNAKGIYLLAPKQYRSWSNALIREQSAGRSRLLTYAELAEKIARFKHSFSPTASEISIAYQESILSLTKRAV